MMPLLVGALACGTGDDSTGSGSTVGDSTGDSGGSDDGADGDGDGGTGGGGGGGTQVLPGDLVINEILANPPDIQDDILSMQWVEIHNATDADLDLEGLEIDTQSSFTFVDEPVPIPANGYILIGASDDLATNGGVPVSWDWSPLAPLALGGGSLTIKRIDDEVVIDDLTYSQPEWEYAESGQAYNLDPSAQNAVDNDDGSNWCPATFYWEGDPQATPAAPNNPCP